VNHRIGATRIYILLAIIILVFGVISWRLFSISWWQHTLYEQKAQAQASGIQNLLMRGNIYLSDLSSDQQQLVATNRKFPVLMLTSSKLDKDVISATIDKLVQITNLSRETIQKAIDAGTSGSRPLLRKLTDSQAAAISEMHASGVTIGYETDRSYPAGMLASDVIGFLGYTQEGRSGQYGIEASYDKELSGEAPHDITLTIDRNIQAYAQSALDAVIKKYNAVSGQLLVQEPTTGRMLAIADSSSFDPNNYGSAPVSSFTNGALMQFEPGSSFKPFTMAMGLDTNKVTPNTTFDDYGDVIVDGYTIKNFNEGHFGRVTMTKVLEKSINTGVMWVEQRVGNDPFLEYVVNMGFGQKTGVDLPGESSGNIDNLYSGRRINFMTAAFGQGIAVTPLQLINGYSAIANGGKLMRPYVVALVRDAYGTTVDTKPEIIGTPFSAKTAATLRTMLTSVVDNGFDKARIQRYDVAGKTGTAQIASPKGGYLEGQYNHSFVGFVPASNPKFVILIRIEKPQGITFAADSLSPVFKDVALFLINYLNIPPTR
jgi:cell division protein FtsI/penicillin-binding protein 2